MDIVDLVLGTAGHVDHGKTTLIRALTGVETDRLPEERRRGISIELGFAPWSLPPYRLGVVDVPGHARFVRQMLVGAAGMDLALLVIAADDSVNHQTLEHLAILRTLEVPAGVVAITKCGLVSPERLEQVHREVRQVVAGSFLESAPLVTVDALEHRGLEQLEHAVRQQAARVAPAVLNRRNLPFRMPIDRVFAVAGHGTVVTGSVVSGNLRVGDEVEIAPRGQHVRVRSLQRHGESVGEVGAGQRAAINLVGVKHDQLGRGDELVTPGSAVVTTRFLGMVQRLADDRNWPRRFRARLHLGAAEREVIVRLLNRPQTDSKDLLVRVDVELPASVAWRQPFVLRLASPPQTIAGGRVLLAQAPTRLPKSNGEAWWSRLESDAPHVRLEEAVRLHGGCGGELKTRGNAVGLDRPEPLVDSLIREGSLLECRGRRWHRETAESFLRRIESRLRRCHRLDPMTYRFPATMWWIGGMRSGDEGLIEKAIEQGLAAGSLHGSIREGLGLTACRVQLAPAAERHLAEIIAQLRGSGAQPPKLSTLRDTRTRYRESFDSLVELAIRRGELIRLDAEHCLHHECWQQIVSTVLDALDREQAMTVAHIRDLLGVTRRHAVPICELLDRQGITRRDGDLRRRGDAANEGGSSSSAGYPRA